MKSLRLTLLLLPALLLAACDINPVASGTPYEVMVVAADSVWDGYAGRALRDALNRDIPMLPQKEKMFRLTHIQPQRYNHITQLFRNIVVLELSDQYTRPGTRIDRDLFAAPQIVMTIHGPRQGEMSAYITEHARYLRTFFTSEELRRQERMLEESHNVKFDRKVQEMFGCHLYIPPTLRDMKVGENFIWASDGGLSAIQNICIYSYPYVGPKVFTRPNFTDIRDLYMKRNIPGDAPGSHMRTNRDYVQTTHTTVHGDYMYEARGLWEMSKEAMGGPFIAHSRIDTLHQRVIVVEAFVYAPDKEKRTMLRRLEGALLTLQLPGKDNENNE